MQMICQMDTRWSALQCSRYAHANPPAQTRPRTRPCAAPAARAALVSAAEQSGLGPRPPSFVDCRAQLGLGSCGWV